MNSRTIGDEHVLQVSMALKEYLEGNKPTNYSETTIETANYIRKIYPNIKNVKNKFCEAVPDQHPDLTLNLIDNRIIEVNLFFLSGQATIQPKNLGAKSFLEKYFLDLELQKIFNDFLEREYYVYLKALEEIAQDNNVYDDARTLKAKIKKYFPKFISKIEPIRQNYLFNIREFCFELMRDKFNEGNEGLINAFKILFLDGYTNIITRHKDKNKCLLVEEFKPSVDIKNSIRIYKKGNNSIGIQAGDEALLLRFKFESGPTSSLKLATSFEKAITNTNIIKINLDSLEKYEKIIDGHQYKKVFNISNAIGKCNEAMVYYQFIKQNPSIHQVDSNEYQSMLERYYASVTNKDLLSILNSSVITIAKIEEYLKNKYLVYKIDSIQLVSDSYLINRLDSSDLKLILKVDNSIIEEAFSLKATAKRTTKITSKNPGIGQILGPQYFDLGESLTPVVKEIKEQFLLNKFDHRESLNKISKKLAEKLVQANQTSIKKGLQALIGSITMVITFYKQNDCVVLEHEKISSPIDVCSAYPSPSQTTLFWNEKKEELALRVKFSAGQSKGWSSIKLACEYKVN